MHFKNILQNRRKQMVLVPAALDLRSLARELGPKGIHVAHFPIDVAIAGTYARPAVTRSREPGPVR